MSTDAAGHGQPSEAHAQSAQAAADRAEQAARLDEDNPQWLVIWGTFSLQFVAFPLFPVPPGTVLCCQSCAELTRRMRQAEAIYGAIPSDKGIRRA
jgi:hypothetical protein